MKKILKNYAEITKYYNKKPKHKLRFFAKTLVVFGFIFLLILIFAPLFNLQIFNFEKENLSAEYYIIYTTCEHENQEEVIKEAEKLQLRGGAGNITTNNDKTIIVLTLCNNLEKTQKIMQNLTNQNVDAKWYAQQIKINTKNLNQTQKQIVKTWFEAQQKIIDQLLDFVDMFENKRITQTELETEVFGLYSEVNAIVLNTQKDVDEKIKIYYQKAINFQSYLFLLSQNNFKNNIPYSSVLRYFTFKLIGLLC